ncbi:MFS transporter [Oenococcus sp.]|uniref:MFS transporter n=1 Tax=Oenococcus sp. TaxID=1979414 RepID=UPI0039ECA5E0
MRELLFQNKAFRALAISNLFETIGAVLFNIVFLIYAAQLPNRTLAISIVSLVTIFPTVLQALLGSVAGRVKKPIRYMLNRRLFQTVLYILEGGLFFFGDLKSWAIFVPLLAINFFSDLTGGLSYMVSMPITKHVVPDAKREVANGLQTAISSTISVIGQIVGATLIVFMNYQYDAFALINALMFAISFFVLLSSRKELVVAEKESQLAIEASKKTAEIKDDKKGKSVSGNLANLIFSSPMILFLIIFGTAVNFIGSSTDAILNLTLLSAKGLYFTPWFPTYGQTVAIYGAVFSVGVIISSLFMNDAIGRMKLTSLAALMTLSLSLASFAFVLMPNRWLILILMFITSYVLGKINPKVGAMMMRVVPEHQLAAISGLFSSIVTLSIPVGQFLFLGIANFSRPVYAWLAMGIIGMLLFTFVVLSAGRFNNKKTVATQTANAK